MMLIHQNRCQCQHPLREVLQSFLGLGVFSLMGIVNHDAVRNLTSMNSKQ
jgi:hypothetical protein